ncbi:DUF805 domain-containing protein [Cellvibrio mixtus]|uniref:DUF805 domain-containing protein n=1 Tax=Cellvibrio mixtus TaxID=39650 RepID=UPI00069394FA|nr:DUF805 domain-containing protein [Cellvibrio mixtus]
MSTNPYQTPEGQLTTDDLAYGEIRFFSPSSRINRLRYWAHSMLFTLAVIGLFIVVGLIAAFASQTLAIGLGIIIYIAMIVFSFILVIQRLHDLNKTGWMSLLLIIPLANIYLLVLLIFFKGTEGRNNYGLQTPPNKTWHWILAFSYPLLVIIGIVAAVSSPAYQDYVSRVQGLESQLEQQSDYPTDDAVDENSVDESATDESAYPAEEVDSAEESLDETATDEVPAQEEVIEEGEVETSEEIDTPQ